MHAVFERLADRMAAEVDPVDPALSLETRLDRAVDFLNERGYLARWSCEDDGFVLMTLNCPYSAVSGKHRELCAMDQRLIGQLLGCLLIPVARLSEGGCRCAYQLGQAHGMLALAAD
jgi:predicted ArsR family transcriptional regulator